MGVRQAQAGAQEAQQRETVFRAALQELTLFKSRTSAALLQVPHARALLTHQRALSVWLNRS